MRLNWMAPLAGLLMLAGCPAREEAEQSAMQDEQAAAAEQGGVALGETGERMAEALETGGEQAQEGLQQAGEVLQDGMQGTGTVVEEGWDDLRGGVQTQLDAMNEWAADTLAGTFTADSPDRDAEVESYHRDLDRRPTYTVESFEVEESTDSQAVAVAVIRVDPADHEHGSERRTSRYVLRAVDGEWRVHEVDRISTEQIDPTQ